MTMPLVEAQRTIERGLTVDQFALPIDGISVEIRPFAVGPGTVVLIEGESAAPVMEILLALAGLREVLQNRLRPVEQGLAPIMVDLERTLAGKVRLNGTDIHALPAIERANQVSLIFENPEWGFLCSTVEEDFNFSFAACGKQPPPAYALRRYGLFDTRHQSPELLSGGEQQRLACAAVMERGVNLVFADFSSSNLDRYFRSEVLRPWVSRARDDGTIFFIRGISAEGMDLVRGVLKIKQASVEYTAHPNGVKLAPLDVLVEQMAEILKARRSPRSQEVLVEAKDFRGEYSKGSVTTKIVRGSLQLIIGPNGAGKTTFGRHVVTQRKNSNQLFVADGTLSAMALQNPERSLFSHSVKQQLQGNKQLLALCGLTSDQERRPPLSLSRSKQKLLSIASTLQIANDIAILDESTLGLDPHDYVALASLITAYPDLAIILMTHDPILISLAERMGYEISDLEIA